MVVIILQSWAPGGGGATWGSCPPWNLKIMTSYAVPVENTLKFSLAPSALALFTLKLRLKRRKIAKIFVRAFGAPKNRSFLSVLAVLPPSGKIPAGAHVLHSSILHEFLIFSVTSSGAYDVCECGEFLAGCTTTTPSCLVPVMSTSSPGSSEGRSRVRRPLS